MRKSQKFSRWTVLSLGLLVLAAPANGQNWWSMSEPEFLNNYKSLATGTQLERGQFAWMMFGRVNQPATSQNGLTFAAWELWATDPETFKNDPKWPGTKERTGPKLKSARKSIGAIPTEEVVRNKIAFDYLVRRGLYTGSGVQAVIRSDRSVEFTIASVEVKGRWTTSGIQPDMYQIQDENEVNYGLIGLHIMVKFAIPGNPITNHSWFWTTFEYKGNPGRDAALKFITFPDKYGTENGVKLLTEANVDPRFANYRLNGTQIDFVVPGTRTPVILGNTTMEAAFAVPAGAPPQQWTAWNASCHSCHYRASENFHGGNPGFGTPAATGYTTVPGYFRLDFDWGIPFNAGAP